MIADVWSKRDYVVFGIGMVAVVVFVVGELIGSPLLRQVALAVGFIAAVVFVGWRVARGPDRRRGPDHRL